MRDLVAAAVQTAPIPGPLTAESIRLNLEHCADWVRRCVERTGAELVVLPEAATTGFTPGLSAADLWPLLSEVPGAMTEPMQELAAALAVHLVLGTYERGEDGAVYNAAVLIGPDGAILGTYRKTHPYCTESVAGGGWVTPGVDAVVVDTALGRIGMIICFDGDFPELARVEAVRGAEIIVRPSALLRPADIWELTNRARAYDNHVFVVGANATGIDPAGVLYFGNSMIVGPVGQVLARAASHEGWVTARLDPDSAMASLSPGSNVPQSFDHLADRNLVMLQRHAADLLGPAATSLPYPGSSPGAG
jgi:predicted amidohydrolase